MWGIEGRGLENICASVDRKVGLMELNREPRTNHPLSHPTNTDVRIEQRINLLKGGTIE
jgi:hypothetical protein